MPDPDDTMTSERRVADQADAIVGEDVARTAATGRLKKRVPPRRLLPLLPPGGAGVGCLLVLLLLVGSGVVIAVGLSNGGTGGPSPAPTPTALATPTESPAAPTESPAAPSPTARPTPTPTESPATHAFTPDTPNDAATDSGVPVPGDAVVDIRQVSVTRHADGALDVRVEHGAPLPAETNSRAVQVHLGRLVEADAGSGVVLVQQRFEALAIFYWQLHEGELTMGELDPSTGQPMASSVVVEHLADTGTFIFRIPADRVPGGAESLGVLSFHRPTATDERRRDSAGLYSLLF